MLAHKTVFQSMKQTLKQSLMLGLLGAAALIPTSTLPTSAEAQFGNTNRLRQAQQAAMMREAAETGAYVEVANGPQEALRQTRLLHAAFARLKPERKGVVDAYVVSVGLDSDGVFGREASETAKVLSRRYDAEGRSITLANGTGASDRTIPDAHPEHLSAALAQISEVMNKEEDVLVLFLTTHGHWVTGLSYKDGARANGNIAPKRLADLLNQAGIKNRLVIISACYSGVFIPALQNEYTVTMTAASSEKPSFGCRAENDWTFFGDAFINNALRQPTPLPDAFASARALISRWETQERLDPSNPQVDYGMNTRGWLDKLELKVPKTASARVGTPALGAPAPAAVAPAAKSE
jgi:Peptidase C13 family